MNKFERQCLGTIAYLGGIPALPEKFVWRWSDLIRFNSEHVVNKDTYIHYDRSQVSYHADARNTLAENMRGNWLLQLDCDLDFEPDLLMRMLHRMQKYDLPVLTGVYVSRTHPHMPVLYSYDEEDGFTRISKWDTREHDVFRVGGAGAGLLLIQKEVFEFLTLKDEKPFSIVPPYSEDLSFFHRCHKYGIPVWCDPRIEASHLQSFGYNTSHIDYDYIEDEGTIEVSARC